MFVIFKDGTKSHYRDEMLDQFKETYFDQSLTPIKIIKVYYFSEEEEEDVCGLMLGIELLDFSDKRICRAGNTIDLYDNIESKQFELK
jgi:hypothetical protein